MSTRESVHALIEALPDDELPAAKRYLEYLRDLGDPMMRLLAAAPMDDESSAPDEDGPPPTGRVVI